MASRYGNVSYVPGSEVRRNALIQGTIKASIVDAANRRALEAEAPGKFIVLPVENLSATDEAVFATADYLKNNAADVDILVEELIKTAREITENPAVAVEFRNKYKLLPDLGAEADAEITAYYKETAEAGSLALNGGGADAAADDFAFFTLAGQIEGDPADPQGRGFLGCGRARPRRRQARQEIGGRLMATASGRRARPSASLPFRATARRADGGTSRSCSGWFRSRSSQRSGRSPGAFR